MSDTSTNAPKTERRRIASRNLIDADGNVTKDIMKAVGAQYVYHATSGKVERVFVSDDPATLAAACFGWLTKIGNVVNTIVNGDDYDGSDPIPAAQAWDAELGKGTWRERAEGVGRASKYDKDLLASVLHSALGSAAKGDVAFYRGKLDDRSYFAKVRNNPQVMAAYYEAVGKEADTMDALA